MQPLKYLGFFPGPLKYLPILFFTGIFYRTSKYLTIFYRPEFLPVVFVSKFSNIWEFFTGPLKYLGIFYRTTKYLTIFYRKSIWSFQIAKNLPEEVDEDALAKFSFLTSTKSWTK